VCFNYTPAVIKYGYANTGIVYFFKQYFIKYVDYIMLNGSMAVTGELEKIWNESVMAYHSNSQKALSNAF
jgi:hypothetical protein